MDSLDRILTPALLAPPHLVARFRAVMWEPVVGTGERIVALLSVEPSDSSVDEVVTGTYPVLLPERLRAIFGRKRGDAAAGVLRECAEFMSARQLAGVKLEELTPLFNSFMLGPVHQARAYSMEQLLDAAVRSVSSLGRADEILAETDMGRPGQTRRTADFLRDVRRMFAGDEDRLRCFNVRMQREAEAPEVWIDYAAGPRVVQVASVPGSVKQEHSARSELKSKLLDLEIVREEFGSNPIQPALLLNIRSLESPLDDDALKVARAAHEEFRRYAEWTKVRLIEVSSAGAAAQALEATS